MLKKGIKYLLVVAAVFLVAFNSVYFKKLDEVKAARETHKFDAEGYAEKLWRQKLLPSLNKAVEINALVALLRNDAPKAFDQYSHALGIGNRRYFLIQGTGLVTAIDDNDVYVLVKNDSTEQSVKLATEYIFGNNVRDASGLVNINEFSNTMDFNNVSESLNAIIRKEVLPGLKKDVQKGDQVHFVGAIELNRMHVKLDGLEAIPVQVQITK